MLVNQSILIVSYGNFEKDFLSASGLVLEKQFNLIVDIEEHNIDSIIVNVNKVETIKTVSHENITVVNGTNSTPVLNVITYDDTFTFLLPSQVSTLAFTNTVDSSNPKDIESVDEIRINATKNLQLQKRMSG